MKSDVVIVDNDTAIIKHYRTGPVNRIGLRKVEFWAINGASLSLDRTSLILQPAYNVDELLSFQCEIAQNQEEYEVKMEEHRRRNLKTLQAELQKNKI